MTELKEKYPDDPARMKQETMKLYKNVRDQPAERLPADARADPDLLRLLQYARQGRGTAEHAFLWVNDLSQPDTVATIFGFPLNVLPLVMAVTMFWQMAISPKSGDAVQQRIFMFMPVIFIVFCYNYASALALYWTVQNLFSDRAALRRRANQAHTRLAESAAHAAERSRR